MQLHKIHRVQKHPALCVIVIVQCDKGLSSYLWDSWGRVGGGWDGGGRGGSCKGEVHFQVKVMADFLTSPFTTWCQQGDHLGNWGVVAMDRASARM